jgi:hypothetical protein
MLLECSRLGTWVQNYELCGPNFAKELETPTGQFDFRSAGSCNPLPHPTTQK